jgi:hypothetical protein
VPLYGVILGRLGFGVPGLTPAQRAVEPVAVGLWIAGIVLYHGVERFAPHLGAAIVTLAVTLIAGALTRERQRAA